MFFSPFFSRISYSHIYISFDININSHRKSAKWQCTHFRHTTSAHCGNLVWTSSLWWHSAFEIWITLQSKILYTSKMHIFVSSWASHVQWDTSHSTSEAVLKSMLSHWISFRNGCCLYLYEYCWLYIVQDLLLHHERMTTGQKMTWHHSVQ